MEMHANAIVRARVATIQLSLPFAVARRLRLMVAVVRAPNDSRSKKKQNLLSHSSKRTRKMANVMIAAAAAAAMTMTMIHAKYARSRCPTTSLRRA